MVQTFNPQVHGECSVWIKNAGTNDAYEEIGVCDNGVKIEKQLNDEDVIVDTFMKTAWDVQRGPQEERITCNFVVVDDDVLDKVDALTAGGSAGECIPAGTMLVGGGLTFEIVLFSVGPGQGVVGDNPCRHYFNVYPMGPSKNLGTKHSVTSVTFRCLPQQQLGTSDGAMVFEYSCDGIGTP